MASKASFFVDDTAFSQRSAEVPNALWNSGMLGGGGAGPGIGISTENPGLDQSLPNWTLLDQGNVAAQAADEQIPRPRDAQIGQNVSGRGRVDPGSYPSSGGNPGTFPDSTIRLLGADELPTYQEKLDGTKLDGELSLPAAGASLISLATGWQDQAGP